MKHLFKYWDDIQIKLKNAQRILFLSDFDGTLAPIVLKPEDAVLDEDTRRILCSLATKPHLDVGVISGRKLSQVRALVGVPEIYYAGNHGLEISGPGIEITHPAAIRFRSVLSRISRSLEEKIGEIKGIYFEDKELTLSIHYRMVKDKSVRRKIKSICASLCQPYLNRGDIRTDYGKKVFEIMPPVNWNKGNTALLLKERLTEKASSFIIYVGDDKTDEDVFRAMSPEDISIYVGTQKKTSANFFLKNPQEVKELLFRLDN